MENNTKPRKLLREIFSYTEVVLNPSLPFYNGSPSSKDMPEVNSEFSKLIFKDFYSLVSNSKSGKFVLDQIAKKK